MLGSEAIRETSTTSTPRQVCNDVVVSERLPERDGNVGGTVAGAIIGGLVGNQVGGGNGRKLATVGGAVAGGVIGNKVDKRHVGGQVVNRTEQRCHTTTATSQSSHVVGYTVTYRNPDGTTGTMRTDAKPGERISLGTEQVPVAYDVTYDHDGQQRHHQRGDEQHQGATDAVGDGRERHEVHALGGAEDGDVAGSAGVRHDEAGDDRHLHEVELHQQAATTKRTFQRADGPTDRRKGRKRAS